MMHRFKLNKVFVFMFLFSIQPVVFGEAKSKDKSLSPVELEKIQKNLKAKGFIGVAYTQKIISPLRKTPREAKGEAFFSSTGKARMNQWEPEKKEVIFDGNNLVEYFPVPKEGNILEKGGQIAERVLRLSSIVLDFNKLLSEFSLRSAIQKPDGLVEIELASTTDPSILSVSVSVDEKKGYVSGLRILYRDQREHDFQFSNPSFEQKDDNLFKAPVGINLKKL